MKFLALSIMFLIVSASTIHGQETETAQQKAMAAQMAKFMDQAWEAEPEAGTSNLRFLILKDGEPYEGAVSIKGRFKLMVNGRQNHYTAFNPNSNGRYVLEGVSPGTYSITIQGLDELEEFEWKKEDVKLKADSAPVFEVELSE